MRVLPCLLLVAAVGGVCAQDRRAAGIRMESARERVAPRAQVLQRAERPSPALQGEATRPPMPGVVTVVPDRGAIATLRDSPVQPVQPVQPAQPIQPRTPIDTPGAGRFTAATATAAAAATAATTAAAVEVDRSARVREVAYTLPPTAYQRPVDMDRHRALLSRVDNTAHLVEMRATALPPGELALSRYYLGTATATAQRLNTQARERPIGGEDLRQLENATQPVQAMQQRLARGETPFERRQVTVTVRNENGRPTSERLRVYVLPAGLVDNPAEPALIRELLAELTFEQLTSPSRGTVLGGEMRVWVGPDFQFDQMAQLVMARSLTRYTPVHGQLTGEPDPNLLFMAPGHVTVPGR